jgi:hypothetical protein
MSTWLLVAFLSSRPSCPIVEQVVTIGFNQGVFEQSYLDSGFRHLAVAFGWSFLG